MRTSLYSILCIVVRLGAVMLFVQTMISLPFAWASLLADQGGWNGQTWLIGLSGAAIAIAFALWLYPGLLARLAAGASSRETFESPIDAKEVQYIAFAVLGVCFAVGGLIELVGDLLRLSVNAELGDVAFKTLVWESRANLSAPALKLVVGIGLTLGARGLTGSLRALRERGLPPMQYEANEDRPSKE